MRKFLGRATLFVLAIGWLAAVAYLQIEWFKWLVS